MVIFIEGGEKSDLCIRSGDYVDDRLPTIVDSLSHELLLSWTPLINEQQMYDL